MHSYVQWNLSGNSPIVIKGIQELSKKNDELAIMNDELKATTATQPQLNENLQQQINELKALIKGNATSAIETTSQSVALNSPLRVAGGAFIAQNVPNPPVNNATRISYNIPKNATKAELVITDFFGKKIKQIALSNNGKGMLNVDTNGLAASAYSYTLLVNGRMVETKKMVVAGD